MNVASYHTTQGASTSNSAAALGRFVAEIVRAHPMIRVWLFRGSLGAGKTTSIRAVLRSNGVRGVVVSPTYTLAQLYTTPRQRFLHIDAYRVRGAHEWAALGIDEALADQKTTIFVEWPEKLPRFPWGVHGVFTLGIQPHGRSVYWRIVRPRTALPGRLSQLSRRQRSSPRRQIR